MKSYEEALEEIRIKAQASVIQGDTDPLVPQFVPMQVKDPEVQRFVDALLRTPGVNYELLESAHRLIYWINNR